MRRLLGALFGSLSLRLLVPLLVLMGTVVAVYGVVNFRSRREHAARLTFHFAERTSDLIKQATHLGMLLNRKDEVDHVIRQIAQSPGVHSIAVYDKRGVAAFSSDASLVGREASLASEACAGCHEGPDGGAASGNRMRVFRTGAGERVLALSSSIVNQPTCAGASCHGDPSREPVLGVLEVQMSMALEEQALQEARWQIAWASLAMAAVLLLGTALFVERLVRQPVRRLQAATHRIAAGDLSTRVPAGSADELGLLAMDFNSMTEDLARANRELSGWSQALEKKVVAKTDELGRLQRQAIHMEKMASLGRLAATVAHELNNPLAGILTYAKLVAREIGEQDLPAPVKQELARYLGLIQKESGRCGTIVKNLLLFARQPAVARGPVRLHDIVERALMLVRHHLEMKGIELAWRPLPGDDGIVGDGSLIEQAMVALLINAIEAMTSGEGGRLTVALRDAGDAVEIEVADTGCGIPPDVMPHIFEPFYSTKESTSGVGLGLAVVYGIVERHGGRIDVTSAPNEGTRFLIRLPRQPAAEAEAAPAGDARGPAAAERSVP